MQPLLARLQEWFSTRRLTPPQVSDPPLRAALFSVEQLAQHARNLAADHRIDPQPGSHRLLSRLDENERALHAFHRGTLAVDPLRQITPAAEWLLDNFYLVQEQIQMARRHLPRGYSRELPRLQGGPSAGFPRVYDLVLELIAHGDAQIDAQPLSAFVAAYQTHSSLKLGELWAIPIMLRLGLIENLQRITTRLTIARRDRDLADQWVLRLQSMADQHPSLLVVVLADMAKSNLPSTSAFVTEFCQRLARQHPALHLARTWLEQRLVEQALSIEQLVHLENQNQAADQVSVSHSIASLRFLSAMDWKEFVESLNRVDPILRSDPAGIYPLMDFATRDRYRHSVEFFSRYSALSQEKVAQHALDLASESARLLGPDHRTAHVGYYLIDQGKPILGRQARVRWPCRSIIERGIHRFPLAFYGGGVALLTLIATTTVGLHAQSLGLDSWRLLAFSLTLLLGASQLAVALMNWLSTLLVKPRPLPRLDFSTGIAPDSRTMVVVPTLLTTIEEVDRLIEIIEIHHLANRDRHLHFALLTDLRDAASESLPGDALLLTHARSGIEALQQRYFSDGPNLFYLFHRPRRWNAGESLWMGYERKRGKLAEFNARLRNGATDRFSEIIGNTAILTDIKYVITLDTDTQLPRDAARKLVGTMAHPLNRPVFDPARGTVTEGYTILQPRVGVSLPSARRSWFARLLAGDAGIDPYTREVSDVYQDVFQEGSFIGKGIYDVDAFEKAMHGRFPENTVLSHDLLEACHARSGLVSDVELYEEYPSRYNVDIDRRHRWIRGDWQITQWLLPRVPCSQGPRIANPLSGLSQWKIFDNLRRSLVPIALLLLILGGWSIFPGWAGLGGLLVVLMVALPGLLAASAECLRKPEDRPWGMHLQGCGASLGRPLGQVCLTLAFLPYDAWISVDAIGRTLLRLIVTHKLLLQWQTSSDSERTVRPGVAGFYGTMWIAPAISLLSGAALALLHPDHLLPALPFLLAWLAAPWIAWRISQPIRKSPPNLTESQKNFLRRTARMTWHYFETFVSPRSHWLPPDNFQEIPTPTLAARTSPTNMGLALLSNLAAWDQGYLSTASLLHRTRESLATMAQLKRHHGHFFNWYDTHTLEPLLPLYVSSVDNGNLAGHLLTLSAGLRELASRGLLAPRAVEGLRDTWMVLQHLAPQHPAIRRLATHWDSTPSHLHDSLTWLESLAEQAAALASEFASPDTELARWTHTFVLQCSDHLSDLRLMTPCLLMNRSRLPVDSSGRLPDLGQLSTGNPQDDPSARQRLATAECLAQQAEHMAAMDFSFLFDPSKDLFTTGFNVAQRQGDPSHYDLLGSEARLCSFVAIALGQVPQDHWFSLGRLLVPSPEGPMLVSWSGSMFEYLMPLLVMPSYENTLLDHSCKAAVQHQIEYGLLRGVPWGISESGFNQTDAHHNYQYRAFGVPGLGLKRGLADDLVVAPYASAMALMVAPVEACQNLQRLESEGRAGAYGFYEAIDYTPNHLPPDQSSATVRSYMVHHQAMSLVALTNLLLEAPMHRRFMACPMLKATALLLQERLPKTGASVFQEDQAFESARGLAAAAHSPLRVFHHPALTPPQVHLLSNGRYHVAVTSAGAGYSRWRDLAVTRWREDATRDCWGTFLYVRDLASMEFWSTTYQPTRRSTRSYEAVFTQARAEFRQRHAGLDLHTKISVSPEDDVELRRITITNLSPMPRRIELTTYAEVVLAPPAADAAHPAFGNLFVQTEFWRDASAVLATRRPSAPHLQPPWLLHLLTSQGGQQDPPSCETDRLRFLGRGGTPAQPHALLSPHPLSNTCGSVLDPIVSLRRSVCLAPQESAVFDFVLGVTENRASARALIEKYGNPRMVDRAFDLAWTHSQVTLRHLDASESDAQLYGRLAGALIYADPARRAIPAVLRLNRRGQSALWSHGISGDAPLVLVHLHDPRKLELVRHVIQAHAYWRIKGLTSDLLILIEDVSLYHQTLHDLVIQLIASTTEAQLLDKPGGIFVRRWDQISEEDRRLLQSLARIVLDDEHGSLAEQSDRHPASLPLPPALQPTRHPRTNAPRPLPPRDLIFPNGLGGFTRDGREYVITLNPGQITPLPWVNVLANPTFGTVVSETGGSYSWAENAHEFRLTPWSNDPVQDTSGEALYLRDEQTGEYWSPTPLPTRGTSPYVVRHGFGYTVFEHTEHDIASELWIYVAVDAPVKFTVLKVRNLSGRPRRLSLTGYWEWVLGELRQSGVLHVETEVDLNTGALLARNHFNSHFPLRTAFIDANDPTRTVSGDRTEFLGRHGDLAHPAALHRTRLSGRVGAGLDPCGAMQLTFDLADGQQRETCFRLGLGRDTSETQHLLERFRRPDAPRQALEAVWAFWNHTLGAIQVDTPDPAVNVMANGWLLYQTLSCRLWGRSGFYQSGGAFGFRDQLQDSMALVHSHPALVREHLLRAAAHQFREGDVQHWWHPPSGRGVRTHFSDDFLWLPYVTCRYVSCVGDSGVLDELVPFLESRPLKPEEESHYELPAVSDEIGSLYAHCVRAIERGLRFGEHGLPLIGGGDWNDGMNRVGHQGRGESVWLAFFLYDVLKLFSQLARPRDTLFADHCLTQAALLQQNIERHAWDGQWYLRAYFDNGEPMGSHANQECQIDSLPQSWSVLSAAGHPQQSRSAMDAVFQRLVHRNPGLIQLFDPPFDTSPQDPGYIKGYIPGVRENGGQYTHAAIWTAMAFAHLGQNQRAWEIWNLLNPVHHGATAAAIAIYKAEPYVVAADVYSVDPHRGRGGWTWYTGSAGWMFQLLLETLLGLNLQGNLLLLNPRPPAGWTSFQIHYRYRQATYHITVHQADPDTTDVPHLLLDGSRLPSMQLPLADENRQHNVDCWIISPSQVSP